VATYLIYVLRYLVEAYLALPFFTSLLLLILLPFGLVSFDVVSQHFRFWAFFVHTAGFLAIEESTGAEIELYFLFAMRAIIYDCFP